MDRAPAPSSGGGDRKGKRRATDHPRVEADADVDSKYAVDLPPEAAEGGSSSSSSSARPPRAGAGAGAGAFPGADVGDDELGAPDGALADGMLGADEDGVRDLGVIRYGGSDEEEDEEDEEEDYDDEEEEMEYDEEEDEEAEEGGAGSGSAAASASASASSSSSSKSKKGAGAGAGAGAAASSSSSSGPSAPSVWRAGMDSMGEGEELDYDPRAYEMYHRMDMEWPCLSFDVIPDRLGPARTRFPLTGYLVAGTQVNKDEAGPDANGLLVMKVSNLVRTKPTGLEEEDDDDDSDAISVGGEDDEPVVEAARIPHYGGINRVRAMPQEPHIVATWAETGKVHLFDVRAVLRGLEGAGGAGGAGAGASSSGGGTTIALAPLAPVFTFSQHKDEGFAVDWSAVSPGRIVSGDRTGAVFVWDVDAAAAASAMSPSTPSSAAAFSGVWKVNGSSPYSGSGGSIEDLQWSPNEAGVFASCGTDKCVRIWDTRVRGRSMLGVEAATCDVNVISWSKRVSYLMVSGDDVGGFKIWDLRNFKA
jgi:hypothetical protein